MVCFGIGNGSGSKLFQAYLDEHPEIYMVPVCQLMYLYPHWNEWRDEGRIEWTWPAIVDHFCQKHASLLDSSLIPGHDGMANLGETQQEHINIDADRFRAFLLNLLADEAVSARTFLLAAHYAYAFARGEDLSRKKVLVYHLHVHEYVHYVREDFPDMQVIGFVRDPRSNLRGRFRSNVEVDVEKLNATDAAFRLRRTFLDHWHFHLDSLERLRGTPAERIRVVRHEDMHFRLEELMHATADFLGIAYDPCMQRITFGGLKWWGASHYGMKPMNKPNPSTVSDKWKQELAPMDWFILEGLGIRYCKKYSYDLFRYTADTALNRILLVLALCLPMRHERWIIKQYVSPAYIAKFWHACIDEAWGKVPIKEYRYNAFYRHKWYNQGTGLHVIPWYRHYLIADLARGAAAPINRVTYVAMSVLRYIGAIASLPVMIGKRAGLSLEYYRHIRKKDEILPEVL